MKRFCLAIFLLVGLVAQAQLSEHIGNANFSDWNGIKKVKNNTATITSGQTVSCAYPNKPSSSLGYRDYYTNASDWSRFAGVSLNLFNKAEANTKIEVTFLVAEESTRKLQKTNTATVSVTGNGWNNIFIPWDVFNLAKGQRGTLQGVSQVEIKAISDKNQTLQIKDIKLLKAKAIYLDASIKGKSAKAGESVEYEIELGNTTAQKQTVTFTFPTIGWEAMKPIITPEVVELMPGELKTCKVQVSIPSSLPQGVREKHLLKAIANGNETTSLELITAVKVPSPFMVHTPENWESIYDKIENYEWAKQELAEIEAKAQKWKVPDYATKDANIDVFRGPYLFHNNEAGAMMNCALAYRLTGKNEYAQKCVEFLRKLSDEEKGYPATLRFNQNNFVKEGGVFQDVARGYDMIHDCTLLSNEDHRLIEKTLRLYVETAKLGNDDGGINNWDLSELAGAFYSALVIQDWDLVEWTLNSPSGIYRQFTQGVMSDGWWYECAVGYNLWCSTMFSEMAIALRPWGINFVDAQHPIGTTPYYSLLPERMKPGLYGMDFNKWGTINKSSVGIKDMWDALIPFLDYRGVIFAVNDAKESYVTGEPYELAYYLYGDPEYAAVLNRGTKRNLLYGVPELPKVESKKATQSAFADNMGIVQLRSQTKDRDQREQIQAVLHYGTHGGYHGHYDRVSLLSMMRYGRSFFNPEMYWYGYKSHLYKFLVQNSINKNMVVVDQKMQEPKESFKTLFYTGEMMQAAAVETKARWSNPPYGGMIYGDKTHMTFAEKAFEEGRSVEVPENAPQYGFVTEFSEPVLQRRLMVMMDDYVVLADYLEAEQEHTFDWLFQMKGFKEITASKVELSRHEAQMSTDLKGSAQFTTDCNWYTTDGTARTQFEMCFGEACDNAGARMPNSEDGPLKIDVFTAWPKQNEIMIGTVPENFGVNKRLWYSIEADNETLLSDSSGVWILGSKNIDLDIAGKKQLVLSTKLDAKAKNNTIFWGDAKLVLADGSEVSVSSLALKYKNVLKAELGVDYYGGPIKIAGEQMPNSTPGMPVDYNEKGEVIIDLTGLNAVQFQAKIGGDFPLGDESSRRKTMAVQTHGKNTRYLSVIEPFESESMVKSVNAENANEITVELLDGRVQEIKITDLDGDGKNIQVSVKEFINGELVREEQTK